MAILAPNSKLVLEYSSFFNEEPKSRLELLHGLSKNGILYELTYLNHLLKQKNKVYFDNSFETQEKILRYLIKSDALFKYYRKIVDYNIEGSSYPILFFRGTFLFAMEEILKYDENFDNQDFRFKNVGQWEKLFKYLLAVNTELLKIGHSSNKSIENPSFENLNPALLPINELLIETNPLFTIYRSLLLFDYFLTTGSYSETFIQFIKSTYGCLPKEFIQRIQRLIMHKSTDDEELGFWYPTNEENPFLDALSKRYSNNMELFKFIGLRKSPFIKINNNDYLLADSIFLIEKCYNQFLNDFWFDRIKKECKNKDEENKAITDFGGYFGRFFEKYCCGILGRIFIEYKHSIFLTLDQLKFQNSHGGDEFSDFYFRYKNKVIIGQIKGGGVIDKSKYGGDIESLYQLDRNEFFNRFGVDQVVKSVSSLLEKVHLFDKGFPTGKQIHVFPILIVNEKVFQTALFSDIFNDRFVELTCALNLGKANLKRLILTHVSDWENLEAYLYESPKRIWDIFESHYRDKKFIPPFSNTINKLIPQRQRIPKDFIQRFSETIR